MTTNKGWIGVDFDGTLAFYDNWRGPQPDGLGEPIPLMVERVKDWLRNGIEVRIFTARVSDPDPQNVAWAREGIGDWCEKHIGQRLVVTATKDFACIEIWDDRAVRVKKNTGMTCCSDAFSWIKE